MQQYTQDDEATNSNTHDEKLKPVDVCLTETEKWEGEKKGGERTESAVKI